MTPAQAINIMEGFRDGYGFGPKSPEAQRVLAAMDRVLELARKAAEKEASR